MLRSPVPFRPRPSTLSTGFTGRRMHTSCQSASQVNTSSGDRADISRSPLRAAAAGARVTAESPQGQEELGLNTHRTLLPKDHAGAGGILGGLSNRRTASHPDGLTAVDHATHSAKAAGRLPLEKANRGQKRLVSSLSPALCPASVTLPPPLLEFSQQPMGKMSAVQKP